MSGYNIKELVQEAQFRWLRPAEVLFILQNYEETQLNHEPPQKPPSGSLFLFNKRVLRFFRKDGHNWRRKKDGKNVGEAFERLKVGNDEALNCYYAHNEDNPHFRRRCYWMLDPAMDHIVLVHYKDTTIGKHSAGPISALTLGSSNIIQSSNNYATQLASKKKKLGSSVASSEFDETYNSTSGPSFLDGSPGVKEALKRIEMQLGLEHAKDNRTFYNENDLDDLGFTYNEQNHNEFEEGSVSLQYPGGMHPYSGEQSAPSRDAFNKRDSSSMMIDIDNVQEVVGDVFGSEISIHKGNPSQEVGGVSGQVPPIGDTTMDNVSQPWGGTHSYSRGQLDKGALIFTMGT